MNDKFDKVYNKITAPENLKKETLTMMKNENARYNQPGGVRRRLIFRAGLAAAAVCVAVLCFVLLRPVGAVYITDMTEGVYYDDVELKDGVIHFVSNRVAISISPNAGNAVIDKEQESQGVNGEDAMVEEITTRSGGIISLQHTASLSLPEMAGDNWSYIREHKIYVTVLKTEKIRYQAAFEIEGEAYELTGIDVTQKEFIDYLYKFLSK